MDLSSEDVIRAAVGPETFRRGAAHAHSGRVHWISSDPGRRVLLASVAGTAAYPHQSLVQVGDARGTRPTSGRCSCPMGMNCKHVAAVLVAAFEDLATASPAAPAWERRLAEFVEDVEAEQDTGKPVGLQLDPSREPGRLGRPPVPPVRLRPVVLGKKPRGSAPASAGAI